MFDFNIEVKLLLEEFDDCLIGFAFLRLRFKIEFESVMFYN